MPFYPTSTSNPIKASTPYVTITNVWSEPPEIDGKAGSKFTIHATGQTADTKEATVWFQVKEIEGSKAYTDPVPPGQEVSYQLEVTLQQDVTTDLTYTIQAGHVENGTEIQDDQKTLTVKVTPPPPPPTHTLTVNSTPIEGVTFTIDTKTATTPYTETLPEGTYTITMPAEWKDPATNKRYRFKQWEDGTTNPTRTINLTADTTITATYEEIVGYATLTGTVKGLLGLPVANAKVSLDTMTTTTDQNGKFTIENIPPGDYTINVTHPLYEIYTETISLPEPTTYTVEIQLQIKKTIKYAGLGTAAGLIISLLLLAVRRR